MNRTSNNRSYTILGLGFAKWRGCDPRALAQSFRRLGHKIIEIDNEDYVSWRWNGFLPRLMRRVFIKILVDDYNRVVLKQAESSQYDFILVFKGMYLKAETLRKLRSYGKPIYNIYPDVSFVDHGSYIPDALQYYDCVFTTKSFHGEKEMQAHKIKEIVHIRHGFDPEVHRPVELTPSLLDRYSCDVSFVGCWSPEKERLISCVVNKRKDLKIVVYGIGWKYAAADFKKTLGNNLKPGVFGDELAIVYNASKVNLGLLSRSTSDKSFADKTTTRTFQIPASKSFMLHEDNAEVRLYFQHDEEILLFDNEDDLIDKLDKALGDENMRKEIAQKAYERSWKEPYDYSAPAGRIIKYFELKH